MNRNQAGDNDPRQPSKKYRGEATWGPKLFLGMALAVLVFFYWLLIYSGGVTVHHG